MPQTLINFSKANKAFADELTCQQIRLRLGTQARIAKKIGTSAKTVNKKLNNPETMTVEDLRAYIELFELTPAMVINFIYGKELKT